MPNLKQLYTLKPPLSTCGKFLNIYTLTIFDTYDRILSIEGEVATLLKNKESAENCGDSTKTSKKRIAKPTAACILVLASSLLFFLLLWLIDRYDNVQFDQILYQLKSPASGTSPGIVVDALLRIVLAGIVVAAVVILFYLLIAGKLGRWLGRFKRYVSYSTSRAAHFIKKIFMPASVMLLVLSLSVFVLRLEIHSFVANALTQSNFIESNYKNPDDVKITFP